MPLSPCEALSGEQCSGGRLHAERLAAARTASQKGRIEVEQIEAVENLPFPARFAGKCLECSAAIKAGQLVRSRGYKGLVHNDCADPAAGARLARSGAAKRRPAEKPAKMSAEEKNGISRQNIQGRRCSQRQVGGQGEAGQRASRQGPGGRGDCGRDERGEGDRLWLAARRLTSAGGSHSVHDSVPSP
jgi:hypothetical protein